MLRSLARACVALSVLAAIGAGFFGHQVRERNRLLDAFLDSALVGVDRSDRDAVAIAVSRAIYAHTNRGIHPDSLSWYERLEATSIFNVSTGLALKHGVYGVEGHRQYGPCGTMTRLLLVSLWQLHVPARKLQLLDGPDGHHGGHTLVEYRVGDRWHVLSPADSSFVWRTPSGSVATVQEIQADSTVFAQIFHRDPAYPYDFESPSNIRWEKLPSPLRAAVRWILGPEAYAAASTPRIYEAPRQLFLHLTLLACLATTLLGAWAERAAEGGARRKRERRDGPRLASEKAVPSPASPVHEESLTAK